MVQVHTPHDNAFDDKMPAAYKVVTNYDSMFSDLPQYPSHSYVPVKGRSGPSDSRPLLAGGMSQITSSSGLQVTGKDRALFFKRPVLQMSYVMPLPHIRYTREMSLSVDDLARHDERRKQRQKQLDRLEKTPDYFHQERSYSSRSYKQPKSSFGTQTDFRESEAQTMPCTLETEAVKGELGALGILKYGRGLPVQNSEDLEVVEQIREQHQKEVNLPPKGDPRRPILQRKIIETKHQIEMNLREKSANKLRHFRVANMKAAVDEWADFSAHQLENRLDRIWKQKQKEKDERMRKIRKIHEKEIKNLEWKCSMKNERLYGRPPDRRRQEFRASMADKIMQQDSGGASTSYSDMDVNGLSVSFGRPRTTASVRRRQREETDNFLKMYNGLNQLEKQTNKKLSTVTLEAKGRSRSVEDVRKPGAYVPRGQKFNHMLDTAYDEITMKKVQNKKGGRFPSQGHLYESFRPVEFLSPKQLTPSASDTEDEETAQRRKTLERLHAEERGRANKLLLQKYDKDQESDSDLNTTERSEGDGGEDKPKVVPEAKIDAFLDEIEGETLGQMLQYLSSELDSSDADSEVVRKRRSQQIDHVFSEITKVTQSAVDRYVDGILLNTIYKKAGQEAGKDLQEKLEKVNLRRASTSDLEQGPVEPEKAQSLKIKRRIKEFQKKHLLAAHEALWGVLGEMKSKGEITGQNRKETEDQIRHALQSLMKPEEVETELRKAIEGLNLEENC